MSVGMRLCYAYVWIVDLYVYMTGHYIGIAKYYEGESTFKERSTESTLYIFVCVCVCVCV
jgi:hypothetical protein